MSAKKIFTVSRLIRLSLLLLSAISITSCGGGFEPFVGVTSGKNKSYAAPVEALNYTIETVHGGSINGGCIPNTSGVEDNEIGKHRFGGGATCGAAYLPAKWKSGMTARINWTVLPYPDWQPRGLNLPGVNVDENEYQTIVKYAESHSAIIPLPPPPPSAGDDFGKVANITVHFLACNQIFITYGTIEEGRNTPMHYKLFAKSQKLCTPRPSIKSMADYRRNKAKLDAIKQERANIKQVILPEYIKELEQQGKLPVSSK
ncbi:hypothetical protein BGI15_07905 [Snodgrassella alvi]|uniref:DUF3304 domain-containing protein n=1 Tax=Snodgrassella TaxID=1193515 RepID=UPI000A04CDE9|nr:MULTISPECIES: DUF3304 domain-containing protein [Snodgrassella]MBI0164303.1 DUF3304 domain-containing protein [Snodgrassella sp. M0351]ORF04326.1 hypothetical protein BGH96_05115 [Snodgrassella alvi]ORF24470.1 hypothetical protein BGI07_08165 [Snodgrassella alvi]ORF32213.1 hypothetical protein BGI10_03460 [Snodgrassella alvi]ORF33475.1 hypothetical protein BGI11_08685 [Snodgrassella alvi]